MPERIAERILKQLLKQEIFFQVKVPKNANQKEYRNHGLYLYEAVSISLKYKRVDELECFEFQLGLDLSILCISRSASATPSLCLYIFSFSLFFFYISSLPFLSFISKSHHHSIYCSLSLTFFLRGNQRITLS